MYSSAPSASILLADFTVLRDCSAEASDSHCILGLAHPRMFGMPFSPQVAVHRVPIPHSCAFILGCLMREVLALPGSAVKCARCV